MFVKFQSYAYNTMFFLGSCLQNILIFISSTEKLLVYCYIRMWGKCFYHITYSIYVVTRMMLEMHSSHSFQLCIWDARLLAWVSLLSKGNKDFREWQPFSSLWCVSGAIWFQRVELILYLNFAYNCYHLWQ